MFEAGLWTLTKIVSVLVFGMSVVPILFLTSPGADTDEPDDVFDTD